VLASGAGFRLGGLGDLLALADLACTKVGGEGSFCVSGEEDTAGVATALELGLMYARSGVEGRRGRATDLGMREEPLPALLLLGVSLGEREIGADVFLTGLSELL